MTTLAIPVTTEPDTLPGNCIPVRADGVLSRVRRTCTAHQPLPTPLAPRAVNGRPMVCDRHACVCVRAHTLWVGA